MDQFINYTPQHTAANESYLEIFSRLPPQPTAKPPLLFVHGSYISAWCWDVHFMPFFARCGYPCYALSLRGHGGSYGHERLHWHGVDDYVDDVAQVARGMERPPILIGHSMGGLVVQKYQRRAVAERTSVPAIALLAPLPPQGSLPMAWWISWTRPWLMQEIFWVQAGLAQFSNYREVCAVLFSNTLPEATARQYLALTQAESQRALLEMSAGELISAVNPTEPATLVLGAGCDALVPPFMIQATAESYSTTAEIIPDISHIMMLDPGWKRVARHILGWLEAFD